MREMNRTTKSNGFIDYRGMIPELFEVAREKANVCLVFAKQKMPPIWEARCRMDNVELVSDTCVLCLQRKTLHSHTRERDR